MLSLDLRLRALLFATFFSSALILRATPPGPISNWTQTYDEEFHNATITGSGTVAAYGTLAYPVITSTSTNPITGKNNIWNVGPRYGTPNLLALEGMLQGNVSVSGDYLNIVVKDEPAGVYNFQWNGYASKQNYDPNHPLNNPLNHNPNCDPYSFAYSGGAVGTFGAPASEGNQPGWTQTYGYFEASIQMPSGTGAWPCFWLLPDRGPAYTNDYSRYTTGNYWQDMAGDSGTVSFGDEVDVVEYMSAWENASHIAHASSNVHWMASSGPTAPSPGENYTDINSLTNPDTTFHTYGVYWNRGTLRFYLDNVQVYVFSDPNYVAVCPEYLYLSCEVTNNDFFQTYSYSTLDASLSTPQTMKVDWVRAWAPTFPGSLPPPTTSDLALGATVWTSSNYNYDVANGITPGNQIPWDSSLLVDGVQTSTGTSNGWLSNNSTNQSHPESVELDLGASYAFNTVTLYPRTDANHVGASFPTAFTIQTSSDGVNWTMQKTVSGYAAPGSTPQPFTFSTINAEYILITGTTVMDPTDYTYRMGFAEITVSLATSGSLGTIDPFTNPDTVSYNYYNAYNGIGTPASKSDFGTVSSGIWSPSVGAKNTDHFVVNNGGIQLVNVGDSVSLGVKTTASDSPGIGLVLSASLTPSASVNQTEVFLQRYPNGYEIANYTQPNGQTSAQTGYSTLTITETAFNSTNNLRTFSVTVSGGGLVAPISTTVYLTGANAYVGLGAFANYNGMEGASAQNFTVTP